MSSTPAPSRSSAGNRVGICCDRSGGGLRLKWQANRSPELILVQGFGRNESSPMPGYGRSEGRHVSERPSMPRPMVGINASWDLHSRLFCTGPTELRIGENGTLYRGGP